MNRVFVVLAMLGTVASHSWIDQLWCDDPTNLGYPRNYTDRAELAAIKQDVDTVMVHKIEMRNKSMNLCSNTQRRPFQTEKAPRLSCKPGSVVHFKYNPNGHVSRNLCLPDDPRGCDGDYPVTTLWYILWTKPSEIPLKRSVLPKKWTSSTFATQLEENVVEVVGQGPFDDDMCGEIEKHGKKRKHQGLPCEGTFQLPRVNTTTTLSFVWFWPFDRIYDVGEEYTTCFDVDVEMM